MVYIGSRIAAIFLVIDFEILLFTNHLGAGGRGGGGGGKLPKKKRKKEKCHVLIT